MLSSYRVLGTLRCACPAHADALPTRTAPLSSRVAPPLRRSHRPLCSPAHSTRRRTPGLVTCQAAQTNGVSTVKIITQGRNVSVTPAIREYAVRPRPDPSGCRLHPASYGPELNRAV
jgi:hypothetical protein